MVEIILASNVVLVALLMWHVRGESKRQISLVKEAFAFIKAGNLEEKVRTDALDVSLKQFARKFEEAETVAPTEQEPAPANFSDVLMRTGRAVDDDGTEWGIG